MVINKKFPGFKIAFKNEENEYSVKYNTNITPSSELVEDRIIAIQSKNAFADDSGTFSVVLAGDTYWDKLIDVNDIMRIYVNPDTTDSKKDYQMVAIGMVSRVAKQGSYDQNQNTYLITGQSFAKPFMKFGLGVIQEVQAVLSSVGWLPDGGDTGIQFTGSNARDVAEQILNRFSKFMKYNYDNKQTPITDFFEWTLDSWTAYENLKDPTPYINFDGSLKQLLDDVTAKPFNELFFRNSTITDKGELVMRRTPFNVTDWKNLDYVGITTREVIEEDVSKSDVETNSIFTVTSPQMIKELAPDVFSVPQFHQSLVDRYGYSKLEVENRYIAIDKESGESDDKDKDKESETSKGTDNLTYNRISVVFGNYDQQTAQVNSKKLVGQLTGTYKGVSKKQAKKAVDKFIETGKFTKDNYKDAFNKDPDEEVKEDKREEPTVSNVKSYLKDEYPEAKGLKKTDARNEAIDKFAKKFKGVTNITGANLINKYLKSNGQLPDEDYEKFIKSLEDGQNTAIETDTDEGTNGLKVFSKMLFNWYHMNSNFYSGEITIVGNPYIELGKRLFIIDKQDNDNWEFYIESVEHKFTFKEGYKTIIGVTRGLKEATVPEGSPYRFGVLWNKSADFKGGLLGEKDSEALKKEGYESKNKKDNDSGGSSGSNDGGSLSKLKKFDGKLPKYDFKARAGNYFTVNQCTWYCYNRRAQLGIPLKITQSNWWYDAWMWKDRSKKDGYSGGRTPKQGAVAVWPRNTPGGSPQFGHVSIVEKVLDGGKNMYLSEYNFKSPEAYGERKAPVDSDVYFIYDRG